jgi:phospho-N-acetylmuramoyl-pentapeptide-transferase
VIFGFSILLTPFWIAFGVSALLAWPIYRLLLRLRSRQTIDAFAPESHQVKQGTPTMGGLIIAAGFVAAVAAAQLFPPAEVWGTPANRILPQALLVFLGFAIIGFLDDFVVPRATGKRGLGWKQKILLEIGVAGVAVWLLYGTLGLPFWVALFLVLFVSNAYNFSDGLDGLAGSLLLGLVAGLLALVQADAMFLPESAVILTALLGAVLPFLILNAPPAKVFMGDVGSLPIGAVIGLVVAATFMPAWPPEYVGTGKYPLVRWDLALPLLLIGFVMIAELVPVPLQVFWYKLTKRRLFPMTPIHHTFEKIGWPETRVVWIFAIVQLLLSIGGVSLWHLLNP